MTSVLSSPLAAALERVLGRRDLDLATSRAALLGLADPDEPVERKAAFLAALRTKGESPVELRGLARGLLDLARAVDVDRSRPLLDTCGTGADGSGSFNLSTAAALVAAAAGVRVVKHGNRAVSSRSGSADLLEACGVALHHGPGEAARALETHGFAFLFAPAFHAATAALAAVRRRLAVRTVFHLLGPLSNPARPTHQVVGAFDATAARLLARALSGMELERAFVVHTPPPRGAAEGHGFDEATPVRSFLLLDVRARRVTERRVDPARLGLLRCRAADLRGGDAATNARMLRELLAGRRGALRDALLLNAGLALELVGRATDLAGGVELAARTIDGGRAARLLVDLAATAPPHPGDRRAR